MGANTNAKRVTMRHPHEDIKNDLVCFDFQAEHWATKGWELVEEENDEETTAAIDTAEAEGPKPDATAADEPTKPAPAKKAAAPAAALKPETKEA
ncbi:MAG: hypothetical protein AAGA17_00155 [Actinomycetota bacterium]